MSKLVREFLGKVKTIDEMHLAKDELDKKIRTHNEQKRVLAWEVSGGFSIASVYFKGDDYLAALNFMSQKGAEISIEKPADKRLMSLKINPINMLESEYKEYFG